MPSGLEALGEVVGIEFHTSHMPRQELVGHEEDPHEDADHLVKRRWRRSGRWILYMSGPLTLSSNRLSSATIVSRFGIVILQSRNVFGETLNVPVPLRDNALEVRRVFGETFNVSVPLRDNALQVRRVVGHTVNVSVPLRDDALQVRRVVGETLNMPVPLRNNPL
jgi:hypothetical protein